MALGTAFRDDGKTSESGALRAISKIISFGSVLNGLAVSQRAAGANMSVDVAIGDAFIFRSTGDYGHEVYNDAVYNVTVTTANSTNPRRDLVVMYVDYAQARDTGVANNTNGVVKIAIVAGTPAASPSDPSAGTIQTAIGASNPYITLARVRVGASASSITNSVIDDLRPMASAIAGLPDKFSAYASANFSIAPTSWSRLIINTEEYDTAGTYDNSTNYRYTAITPGYRVFSATAEIQTGGSGETYIAGLYKNGTEYKRGSRQISGGAGNLACTVNPPPIYLAAGDYVEFWFYNGSGGSKTITGGLNITYFGGYMVGTA